MLLVRWLSGAHPLCRAPVTRRSPLLIRALWAILANLVRVVLMMSRCVMPWLLGASLSAVMCGGDTVPRIVISLFGTVQRSLTLNNDAPWAKLIVKGPLSVTLMLKSLAEQLVMHRPPLLCDMVTVCMCARCGPLMVVWSFFLLICYMAWPRSLVVKIPLLGDSVSVGKKQV